MTPTGPAIPRRTSHGLLRDCDGIGRPFSAGPRHRKTGDFGQGHFDHRVIARRQNARHVKQLGHERVLPRDQVLEVRWVNGALQVARKERHPDEWDRPVEPYDPAIPRRTSHGLLRDCDGSRRTPSSHDHYDWRGESPRLNAHWTQRRDAKQKQMFEHGEN
jgi:hypothetical protein